MWLWLQPYDVLLFRDSRPFSAGETHRARSLFPPSPLAVQGALRTLLLHHALSQIGKTFEDYAKHIRGESKDEGIGEIVNRLGDDRSFGGFKMRGPFLGLCQEAAKGQELFFPAPLDLLSKGQRKFSMKPLPKEKSFKYDPGWPHGLRPLWSAETEAEDTRGFWLKKQDLENYLAGKEGETELVESDKIYPSEHRVGIELERGIRTVQLGKLYTAEFVRLAEGYGFLVEVLGEYEALTKKGVLKLGGEGRVCTYKPLQDVLDPLPSAPPLDGAAGFKLYLASPAIFFGGWKPDFLQADLTGRIQGLELRLVAAAVGKPLYLGGWDLAHACPRDLFPAVPPGSVYFFEILEGNWNQVVEIFHGKTALQEWRDDSGDGEKREHANWFKELAKIGFGLSFVGRWDYEEVRDVQKRSGSFSI